MSQRGSLFPQNRKTPAPLTVRQPSGAGFSGIFHLFRNVPGIVRLYFYCTGIRGNPACRFLSEKAQFFAFLPDRLLPHPTVRERHPARESPEGGNCGRPEIPSPPRFPQILPSRLPYLRTGPLPFPRQRKSAEAGDSRSRRNGRRSQTEGTAETDGAGELAGECPPGQGGGAATATVPCDQTECGSLPCKREWKQTDPAPGKNLDTGARRMEQLRPAMVEGRAGQRPLQERTWTPEPDGGSSGNRRGWKVGREMPAGTKSAESVLRQPRPGWPPVGGSP